MTIICIIFSALFGAVFGSFLNMLIYRLPNKVPLWGKDANHSRCPKCGYFLNWQDLFPIASYVWLKGRCRYCHTPIGARYVWVEVVCAVLGVVAYVVIS